MRLIGASPLVCTVPNYPCIKPHSPPRNASRSDIFAPCLTSHPPSHYHIFGRFVYFLVCRVAEYSYPLFPLWITFRGRDLRFFYGMGSRSLWCTSCVSRCLRFPNKWYGEFGRCAPGQRGRPRHLSVEQLAPLKPPSSTTPPLKHGVSYTAISLWSSRSGAQISVVMGEIY